MCPLLYQILNKLDFHIKQSYQTPKYLLNKYEMTIKVKTSDNLLKLRWAEEKNPLSVQFIFFPMLVKLGSVESVKLKNKFLSPYLCIICKYCKHI